MTSDHVFIGDSLPGIQKWFLIPVYVGLHFQSCQYSLLPLVAVKGSFISDFSDRIMCLLYMLLTVKFPSCFKFESTYP